MLTLETLDALVKSLSNSSNPNKEQKQVLLDLFKEVFEAKDSQEDLEKIIAALKEKVESDLKTELTEQVKADLKTELTEQVKAGLEAEMKEKVNNLEQLEKKNKDLQDKLTEAEDEKTALEAEKLKVQQLTKEKEALEAKNKTIQQPKPGKGAAYTAGVGLAAGLAVGTALEHITKLRMLAIVGIAVASTLVVGLITYAALKPSTEVDGAKIQGVNGKGK